MESTLRRRAEDLVSSKAAKVSLGNEPHPPDAMQQLLHELQVHQLELEMQNDELRKTQQKLDAARARYFDLYDLAPVGYCTVSEHGVILEANLTAASLLNLVRGDLVKQAVSRFIVKSDQDIYYQCRKALFQDGMPQDCELQMVKKDGIPFWAHMTLSVSQSTTGEPLQRMVLNDISERKRVDSVLLAKNQELEAARSDADRASLAKSIFLSNMSHELRSPLNAILGFAQLMELTIPAPTPAQKNNIDHILRAGWYLLDLVSEILDLSAIESGKLSLSLKPVSLSELLQDSQAQVAASAQKKNVHLYFSQPAEPLLVHADPARLKQVLHHLISNAIQYNRVGGTVEVTCHPGAFQSLRISVRDTGEGLSTRKIEHLFQPFNRLDRETNAEAGTGVGLALSKRLVELMGGTIGAQSSVGVGSVFWIELNQSQNNEAAL
jgi:PAS domain S-box-containing protein